MVPECSVLLSPDPTGVQAQADSRVVWHTISANVRFGQQANKTAGMRIGLCVAPCHVLNVIAHAFRCGRQDDHHEF